MSSGLSPLASLLPSVSKKGKPLLGTSRIQSVQQAHDVYYSIRRGDMESALNRARVQLVLDGYPPFDPGRLRDSSQAGIANINVGLLKTYLDSACQPTLDQLNSLDRFVRLSEAVKKKKDESSEEVAEWCSIVEEKHFKLITNGQNFNYTKQKLVMIRSTYGVAVPFFADTYDWNYEVETLGEFLIPHFTKATEDAVEVACMVRSRQPHELAKYLGKGSANWNKKAIELALKNAKPRTIKQDDWERMQYMWKDNDIWMTSQCDEVTTVDMWVKEMNGKVSHFIFPEDGSGEFLFKKVDRFESQSQAFQMFPLDVGTNGFYHSIRGLGFAALDLVQEINRTFSSFMDAIRLEGKLLLQPANDDALQNLNFLEHSGYLIAPTGYTVITRPQSNLANAILPCLQFLEDLLNQKTSRYTAESGGQDFKRQNKQAIMAHVATLARIGSGNSDLFFQSWERLQREQFRRINRKGYLEEEPGGKAVHKFKKECEDLGVPKDFWDRIDVEGITAERAVGAGSASEQMQQYEALMELFDKGFFDAEGGQAFKADITRSISTVDKAKRYVPKQQGSRPPIDKKMAILENYDMDNGKSIPVEPNENHLVHALAHIGGTEEQPIGSLFDDANALQQALQQNDDDAVIQIVPAMTEKHAHTAIHVDYLKNGLMAGELRQKLQQIGGLIYNSQKKRIHILEQRAKEQQKQQLQAGGGNGDMEKMADSNFNLERQIVETQVKLRNNEDIQQQKLAHREADSRQKRHLKDLEGAQKLAIDHALAVSSPR